MKEMQMILRIKFLIISFLFLLGCFSVVSANYNVGFVNGLWYSKTPFFAEDEVRIYTVIQNQSGFDIIGRVQFFDNGKLLNQSNFSIVNGRLTEKWSDWKPTLGEHEISIKISNTKKVEVGQNPEVIDLTANTSISEKYNIDLDTDKDGIGNKDDRDDDNDGISDIEEKKAGTNPLVFDKPVIEKVKKSQNEKNIATIVNGKNNENNTTIDIENVSEKTKELTSIVKGKTIEIVNKTKDFLEKQKKKVVGELEQKKKEETLKGLPKIDESKNPFIASLIGSVPELKEVYSFLLSVLIYILNSWWILLGSVVVLVYLIWKIIKRRFKKRY